MQESSESVTPPKEETDLIEKKSELVAEETIPKTNPVLALLPTNLPNDIPVKKEETVTKTDDEEGQIPDEGQAQPSGQISAHPQPTVDESLVKLLDYLVLYLRIVHSLDYYSGAEYLYEDDMPNRCGIIHIRNSLPDKVNYEEGSACLLLL